MDYYPKRLKKGVYDAYRIDDNLMIVHTDSKDVSKESIKEWEWEWKSSNVGVGIDSKMFGFYDEGTINKLRKIFICKNK